VIHAVEIGPDDHRLTGSLDVIIGFRLCFLITRTELSRSHHDGQHIRITSLRVPGARLPLPVSRRLASGRVLHDWVLNEASAGEAFAAVTCNSLDLLPSGAESSGARPLSDGQHQEPGGWNRLVLAVADLVTTVDALKSRGVPVPHRHHLGAGWEAGSNTRSRRQPHRVVRASCSTIAVPGKRSMAPSYLEGSRETDSGLVPDPSGRVARMAGSALSGACVRGSHGRKRDLQVSAVASPATLPFVSFRPPATYVVAEPADWI